MEKIFFLILIIIIIFSCKENNESTNKISYIIKSSAFKNNGKIPKKYTNKTNGGKNISIPLKWENAPSNTKSFCLIIVDNHPVANNFIHWFIINIPANIFELQENISLTKIPSGVIELNNSYGYKGYGGPLFSKENGVHNYEVILYSLNTEYISEFKETDSIFYEFSEIEKILDKYLIQKTKTTFTY
jgi:Raf kinase inhibitor-like YbhB/YbcL family protein